MGDKCIDIPWVIFALITIKILVIILEFVKIDHMTKVPINGWWNSTTIWAWDNAYDSRICFFDWRWWFQREMPGLFLFGNDGFGFVGVMIFSLIFNCGFAFDRLLLFYMDIKLRVVVNHYANWIKFLFIILPKLLAIIILILTNSNLTLILISTYSLIK